MRLVFATLLTFVLVVAVAVGYPPLEVSVERDSITLANLDCGQRYKVEVSERRNDKWRDSRTKKRTTDPCPEPPSTGFPDASNTGVPDGTTLTQRAGFNVHEAGTVIDGVRAPWIYVNAPNVTIRNSVLGETGAIFPLQVGNGSVTVEDSTLFCGGGYTGFNGTGTLRRVEITGCDNGITAESGLNVLDSWIHDLDTTGGAHTDGIETPSGVGNLVIRHNTIDPQSTGTPASTSAIIMYVSAGPQNYDVRIENNRLLGDHTAYTLYAPRNPTTGIYINNNRFERGGFGYTDSVQVGRTVAEFNGNVDDITGAPIGPGGSCGAC